MSEPDPASPGPVLTDPPGDADSAGALLSRYEAELRAHVDEVGPEQAAAAKGVERTAVDAVERGEAGGIDLGTVTALLALGDGKASGAETLSTVREHLLLEMSAGMLTVDRVAAALGGDLDPKEVQGKLEGRLEMTLAEYAELHHAIATAR